MCVHYGKMTNIWFLVDDLVYKIWNVALLIYVCCSKAQYANHGGWGQILAYMAFCEVSQEQTPGSAAYAGDFGFKVLTASDPAEKTKKLNAEIANGRLAMMAIIGMFFQAGVGVCADIVCYNSTRKETPRRVRLKECNNVGHQQNQHKEEAHVSIRMACSEFMKFLSCQPRLQHTTCLIVWLCSHCHICPYFHICLPIRSVGGCAGNEKFHDVTCTDCTIDITPSKHAERHDICRFGTFHVVD